MADRFRAIVATRGEDKKQSVSLTEMGDEDLMEGDVVIRVTHSTLNYKDGLALTGKSPVIRRFPMVPGIDLAGEVVSSGSDEFVAGQKVLVTGCGMGETHWGGYAEKARVPSDWVVHMPKGYEARDAMAVGTAGFTAMLCVLGLEKAGVTPESGEVLVTGAAGGVGSVAVAILGKLGYKVIASTGRVEEADYLKKLGAADILPREELAGDTKPLDKVRWAGAVDVVGGKVLANVLAQTAPDGAVSACGLAGGMGLETTVAPFILRGVSLVGINSVVMPRPRRLEAWHRIEKDLDLSLLHSMTHEVPLSQVIDTAPDILAGTIRGRTIVTIDG